MELVYILKNTDMINLAASMINYVKIPPYNVNLIENNNGSGFSSAAYKGNTKYRQGNFFDK